MALAAGTGIALVALAQAPGDRVVVRVKDEAITVAQVERQLARVPVFQLQMLGGTDGQVRDVFIQQVIDVELYVQAALEDKLDGRQDVQDRIRDVLKAAVISDITKEAMEAGKVTDEAVQAYYDERKGNYQSKQRIKLWQIVVKEKAEAEHIIKLTQTDPDYQKDPAAGWEKLARERSLDKSTSMRSGDLGFVEADGTTAHTDVAVSPAFFKVAQDVNNGEVVPEPVKDGEFWVVLQRRGSHRTPERSLASETTAIRTKLAKQQVRARAQELLDGLRDQYVSERLDKRVDEVVINSQGDVEPRRRPGTLRRRSHAAAKPPQPSGPPGRLR
ncbi:MAG: peptidyl-prolyl cis-trans isomerase [Deltaproteobacteria bacterium]|nr:peptidyl-prolyl cis-trans isomerase [Deltaproteobacteria bacterium]